MKYVASGKIDGEVKAPPSKSMTVRALALASLVDGDTRIDNPSSCEDAASARDVIEALGCEVNTSDRSMLVRAGGAPTRRDLDCGESGLALRMFSAVAALQNHPLVLKARGSLRTRPMGMIPGPLGELGLECHTSEGKAPVKIRGPMMGGKARVDGSETSQFLSGLLVACPLAERRCELHVSGLQSKPYVLMTLDLLESFGITWEHDDEFSRFYIDSPLEYRRGMKFQVEGDWSGASALLVLGAMAGAVRVSGLRADSLQADRAVLDALGLAGATISVDGDRVEVLRNDLKGFCFDVSQCPDLAPSLAALACACDGKSLITGTGRLRNKESDRVAVLVEELGKMGADIRLEGDTMVIKGRGALDYQGADPHGDHRMAMACAVAAVGTGGSVGIVDHACVAKSYPGFFGDLASLGAEVR